MLVLNAALNFDHLDAGRSTCASPGSPTGEDRAKI